jgi:hypothetical protein
MEKASSHYPGIVHADEIIRQPSLAVAYRDLSKICMIAGVAAEPIGNATIAWTPQHSALTATAFPGIHCAMGYSLSPGRTASDVQIQPGPAYTAFLSPKLNRTPSLLTASQRRSWLCRDDMLFTLNSAVLSNNQDTIGRLQGSNQLRKLGIAEACENDPGRFFILPVWQQAFPFLESG